MAVAIRRVGDIAAGMSRDGLNEPSLRPPKMTRRAAG